MPARQAGLEMDPTVVGLAELDDSHAPTQSSGDVCWRWRGYSAGRSTRQQGTEVPSDPPAAANASGSREANKPVHGIHREDGARLAGSGPVQ